MNTDGTTTAAIKSAGNPAPCRIDWAKVVIRRRAQRELTMLLAEMYPQAARMPCDFGLSQDELRRHARNLYRDGWRLDEIKAVLDLKPVSAP